MSAPRRVAVVPHTHWDREWYEPFQTFRLRLVDLVDQLIPLLETDPSYARYMLDGQMAVVDDYLEIRPEMEERLRRLAASGRVAVGPWYILVDEFLVSGETIIRDLQLGLERGAAFGGATSVGYLPDMFGHIAQMPQILRQAGFSHTVLWRGVPSAVTKTGFTWVAPDGTDVRAEYLVTGYGNGASLPADAKALLERVRGYVAEVESFLMGDLLYMNGSDHLLPQRHLGRVLAEANELQDEFRFEVSSLAEYLATAPTTGLESWHGELRSGFRSNILMGVLSNRVDVKRLALLSEIAIERRAEPYAALFQPADQFPDTALRLAWREIIRNAAHDSICACSVDDTDDAVLHRFREARQISTGLADRALKSLAETLPHRGHYVVNPRASVRSGLVETTVADDEFDGATMQVVSQRGVLPDEMLLDATGVRAILSIVQGTRIDEHAWVHAAELGRDGDVITLDVTVGASERSGVHLDETRAQLRSLLAAEPGIMTRVSLNQPTIRHVLSRVEDVPAFGWTSLAGVRPRHPVSTHGEHGLTNGLVTVDVDSVVGTFSLDGRPGFGQIEDGGDLGDSYNYSPPANDWVVNTPTSVAVAVTESGPLRGRLFVTSTYEWPLSIAEATQVRTGTTEVNVETTIELRADERAVFVRTSFVNPARDHRVRIRLPLVEPTNHSRGECAFTTIERGLTAEGRPEEFGLPTFPSRRFVCAGGLTVAHRGLHEYELVDISEGLAHSLAMTILRSTGMLSRLGMSMRPLPAGPLTPVEGLQMVGQRITADYVVTTAEVSPYELADELLVPMEVISSIGTGTRPATGSALEIRGAEVSSVRRVEGVLEVRVFNPTDAEVVVDVGMRRGWLIDLRGRGVEPFEGRFTLRAQGIQTLRLDEE